VSNSIPKQHLIFIEILEKNLHQHLYRLSKIFYDPTATNVQLFNELKTGIETGLIRLDVDFNSVRQDKLYRTLKITKTDERFDKRHNIIYMITVPKSEASTIRFNYKKEQEFLNNDLSDDILIDQFNLIANVVPGPKTSWVGIPKYSGAKWIGRLDRNEMAGNMIGFINEASDTIEICEIIGTHKYLRREKRPSWKDATCRDRNILYLSSIKGEYKLSMFKQDMKINKSYKIPYMKQFEACLI